MSGTFSGAFSFAFARVSGSSLIVADASVADMSLVADVSLPASQVLMPPGRPGRIAVPRGESERSVSDVISIAFIGDSA